MYVETIGEFHIDSIAGKIPIEVSDDERLVRFLSQGDINKKKPKPRMFYPHPAVPNKISFHRLEYSNLDHCKVVGLSVHKLFIGLAMLGAKHIRELGIRIESVIEENRITQHVNICLPTKVKKEEPASDIDTDLFHLLYEFVKKYKLYYKDSDREKVEWQGGKVMSKEECFKLSIKDS